MQKAMKTEAVVGLKMVIKRKGQPDETRVVDGRIHCRGTPGQNVKGILFEPVRAALPSVGHRRSSIV